MAWAKNGTPVTLGSAGDVLTVSDMTASKFNQIIVWKIGTGSCDVAQTFANDSGSKYARRFSYNGGTDNTSVNQTSISLNASSTDTNEFFVQNVINITGEEILGIAYEVGQTTAGAGTAPTRMEFAYKSTVTTPFTRIDETNGNSGSFDTGANLSALGSDGVESLNVQDGAVYYETDTNKSYVLYNNSWTEL